MRKYSALLAILLLVLSTSFAILHLGLESKRMGNMFEVYGDWSFVPFPKEASHIYAKSITDYLSGASFDWDFSYESVDYGALFSKEERLHMKDVRHIFSVIQILFYGSLFGFLGLAYFLQRKQSLDLLRVGKSLVFILLGIGIVTVIGIQNFRLLFLWMHKLLFTNHNWLLSKEKDIIINLMPLPFFMEMAKILLLLVLGGIVLAMLLLFFFVNGLKKGSRVFIEEKNYGK